MELKKVVYADVDLQRLMCKSYTLSNFRHRHLDEPAVMDVKEIRLTPWLRQSDAFQRHGAILLDFIKTCNLEKNAGPGTPALVALQSILCGTDVIESDGSVEETDMLP